ncbi:MAG TPA: L,D-transpeptidase family protein [Ktedonobacteraceae bacterium]|nr:L,D-transpeptidase family protein [Ktedonobacteraceae bacterium]
MQENSKKLLSLGLLVPLLVIIIAFSPLSSDNSLASSTWTGTTTYWANVRTGPSTSNSIVTAYAPGTNITVYATVSGQVVWGGISNWYRISSLSSSPRYIYSGLVSATTSTSGGSPSPTAAGKEIIVSLSRQWVWAYQNGVQVFNSPVMTGRPTLATPTGTYHVFLKLHPTTFTSPWPPGSPYWYPPTYINYALGWRAGGFFLHDSWWHSVYGPGTNGWHYDPKFGWQWGTHGCIAMPLSAASWLYYWAPIGTLVQVNP